MTNSSPDKPGDILIVDDKPENLRLLSQMLTEHGYDVRAAISGTRALASVAAMPPDLILLDIRMPEMNGYEVCQALKADAGSADIPIIFISALSDISDKVQAFRAGGVDYITKPFHLEEVLARTETHLALRRLQRSLQLAVARYERELMLAGQLQASFLPRAMPEVPGWQLAAALRPARETSGDFYDACLLPGGRLGLIVGDVADKGAGAALFMALCWSLLRTYLPDSAAAPHEAFTRVNQRILADTNGVDFVCVFFGVVDVASGHLIYCNAGQTPPLHVRGGDVIGRLASTGPPLGVLDAAEWRCGHAQLAPGDTLLLCTDGVLDANDQAGQRFGHARLGATMRALAAAPATDVLNGVLHHVDTFVAGAHQFDDIAIIVAQRLVPQPAQRLDTGVNRPAGASAESVPRPIL